MVFLLPYRTLTIKGNVSNDSIGGMVYNISDPTGLIVIKLIAYWSKPLAEAVLASGTLGALLPTLEQGQRWEEKAFITSCDLTDNKLDNLNAKWRQTMCLSFFGLKRPWHLQLLGLCHSDEPQPVCPHIRLGDKREHTHKELPNWTHQSISGGYAMGHVLYHLCGLWWYNGSNHATYPHGDCRRNQSTSQCIHTDIQHLQHYQTPSQYCDFISHFACWPSNLSTFSKDLLSWVYFKLTIPSHLKKHRSIVSLIH